MTVILLHQYKVLLTPSVDSNSTVNNKYVSKVEVILFVGMVDDKAETRERMISTGSRLIISSCFF